MLNIAVTVRNGASGEAEDCEIQIAEEAPVSRLVEAIMHSLGWRIDDPLMDTTHYLLRRVEDDKGQGPTFEGDQAVREASLLNGDMLVIESPYSSSAVAAVDDLAAERSADWTELRLK